METITTQLVKKYQYPIVKKLSSQFAEEINYVGVKLTQLSKLTVFVIKKNKQIVGYSTAKQTKQYLLLNEMYILPQYRSAQFKTELMDFISRYTSLKKCDLNTNCLISVI